MGPPVGHNRGCMAANYTDDHLGTLVVMSRPDLETTIPALTLAKAKDVMFELSVAGSPVVVNHWGHIWVLSGLSYAAAEWSPDPAPGEGDEQ